ncbi:MAG TPA: 5'/3'-nucleotidase SurE [Anaerolineales bacterium]|nr:5'/3'-nucleotidase SurE [Anaerolineales bacterium]
MHILVTNDDGVHAPGLLALAQAMRQIGQVTVFAPDRNWSASGHVKTLERPIRVTETVLADGTPAFMSDGAPSDCVALPLLGYLDKVDLVVSGINPFSNIGHDVTYSGTVTAAMEAVIAGVPGIAFSLASQDKPANILTDYGPAGDVARRVVQNAVETGLLQGVVLNVNIPYLSVEEMQGIHITRQGLRVYRDALDRRVDPRGRPYYWIGGEAPTGVNEEGTDVGALVAGYVSITPLQLDLTNYKAMDILKGWEWKY